MTSREDALFGRIALDQGLVTAAELRQALESQAKSPRARLLGSILIENGVITADELRAILAVQREKLRRERYTKVRQSEDASFGSVAVSESYLSPEEVRDAYERQAQIQREKRLRLRIGEVLVAMGKLTEDQVRTILHIQHNRFVSCSGCGARFRILDGEFGQTVRCDECGTKIVLARSEFANEEEATPPAAPGEPGPPPPTAPPPPEGGPDEDEGADEWELVSETTFVSDSSDADAAGPSTQGFTPPGEAGAGAAGATDAAGAADEETDDGGEWELVSEVQWKPAPKKEAKGEDEVGESS